jgi:iron complex outermembrane recepter protein
MFASQLLLLISLAAPSAAPSSTSIAAPAVIGTVVDSAGAPLANATVLVAEVARATTTNPEGKFTLRGLPAGEYHLNVSLLGYAPGHVIVKVPPAGEDVTLRVVLAVTPLRLSAVIVSASPTGTDIERLTQAAVELSGNTLARSVGSSVASTLAGEPGVSQRYGGPAASMPVIRGLTGDRILVLQDGERSGDLASSASDHAVSVDPLAAQRVEVVRGPASLLYGSSALGGVVNVVSNDIPTSVPSHLEGYLAAQGESGTPGGALSASATTKLGERGVIMLRGGYRDIGELRTGGAFTLDGTDSRTTNAALGYGLIGERLNGGVALRLFDFNYGLPSAVGDPEAGIRIDGRRVGASARTGLQLGATAIPYLRIDGSYQDYTHDEIEADGALGTNFSLLTQTLNAQATTAFGHTKGALGLQALFKQYDATGDEALTPGANSTGFGAFVFQEIPLSGGEHPEHGANVQAGLRYDLYRIASETGDPKFGPGRTIDFSNFSGSLGVSVPIGDLVIVSGSLARAFRAPTVEELHSHAFHAAAGTYDIGNPDLDAEHSGGAEVIVRMTGERIAGQVAAYTNHVSDYITPNIVGDTLVDGDLVPKNVYAQGDALLRGFEATMEARLGEFWVVSAMGDLVHGQFRPSSDPLPFMPPARVGAGLRWEKGRLSLSGDARHGFAQDRVSGGTVDIATDAYTIVNVSASSQWKVGGVNHQVTLRADNVGDARYFDSASRIKSFAANPGRNVSLVYRVVF